VVSAQQTGSLEYTLDLKGNTIPLPQVFKPNIDLSGRGFPQDVGWPQSVARAEVLTMWDQAVGFQGMYRIQYDLWEISQLSKNKEAQDVLLRHYENLIKNISDAGGIVILDIFGTPAGLGKILDKKIPPRNLPAFKQLVKNYIRKLSCEKRYSIWYEVWSAPDIDDFFLGRKQDYLTMYRLVAESVQELEHETKIHIPLGGPGVSWWFQNPDGNTIATPERSLIYNLLQFCHRYRLPLDFITWHCYSTDPAAEKELTIYNKSAVALIRDWLSYFNFARDMPLVISEWNYDRGNNVLPERKEEAYIAASYIPARLKNMFEAGIDGQVFFCLEDFLNIREGIVRNVGVFWFDPASREYKGGAKAHLNVFKMLSLLGDRLYLSSAKADPFIGMIPTKKQDTLTVLLYNYCDPEIVRNYISRNIASLNKTERRLLLALIQSDTLSELMSGKKDMQRVRLPPKAKALLMKAKERYEQSLQWKVAPRDVKLTLKNIKGRYAYQRYVVDSSCSLGCAFVPVEEKEVQTTDDRLQESISLKPYSVQLLVLKKMNDAPKQDVVTATHNTSLQGVDTSAAEAKK
jgi:hypothetical protein